MTIKEKEIVRELAKQYLEMANSEKQRKMYERMRATNDLKVGRPPVLLDEALSQLDDNRASGLLKMLTEWCADGNQCLLFTCHTRESSLASNFTHIKL